MKTQLTQAAKPNRKQDNLIIPVIKGSYSEFFIVGLAFTCTNSKMEFSSTTNNIGILTCMYCKCTLCL